MRELEAVEPLADLLDVGAVLIELEDARVAAPRVDEDVALRVGGDADAFTEIQIGRQLEEVGHRGKGNLGHVLGLGLGLRRDGRRRDRDAAAEENRGNHRREEGD